VNAAVLAALTIFVIWQLQPSQLLSRSLPSGGDMGAHVWQPAFLRDHLLPHGRLTGWAPDWYAGFPSLVFYFPLPSLMVVLLGTLLPYGMAFKLVSVLGLVTLPVAAFCFARLLGMRDPLPAGLAVATLPYLFDRTITIYGGNIASTLAGEFSFSISLSLALVFLGVFARGLEDGRHRSLAAVLLALTALCHVVPAMFAVAGAVLLLLFRLDRHRLRWAAPALATAGALAAFWVVPFVLRIAYTNDMGWEKIVKWQDSLFPSNLLWVVYLAVAGAVISIARRRRAGVFLAVLTLFCGFAFVNAPQGRLWNARLLPFWFLCVWLLAGLALAETGSLIASALGQGEAPSAPRAERAAMLATPVAMGLGALVLVAFPLRVLWGGHLDVSGNYHWLGFESKAKDASFLPSWVHWNYSGYQSKGKSRHDEYFSLMATMGQVGRTDGCGRAMWEYEPELDAMGTPMAPMLLPYWTHGCIGSMEGLFFESSATTPFHFLNQSELSKQPSRPQRNLPYVDLNVASGVDHLKLLGVRYYMAISPEAIKGAATNPDLRLVATSGPWQVLHGSSYQSRTWQVYEVAGSDEVAPLSYRPAVMKGVPKGGQGWLKAAVDWYQDETRWDVPLAVSGPKDWPRVEGASPEPPRLAVAPASVSHIRTGDDRISFDVDRVGSPVLVKASYFPNWKVSGAKGPYRVTPNQMVVIPTSKHVSLHYGFTPVDALGWLLTVLGLAALVAMWRRGPVRYPDPPEPAPTLEEPSAVEPVPSYTQMERVLAGAFTDGQEPAPVGSPPASAVDANSYFDDP